MGKTTSCLTVCHLYQALSILFLVPSDLVTAAYLVGKDRNSTEQAELAPPESFNITNSTGMKKNSADCPTSITGKFQQCKSVSLRAKVGRRPRNEDDSKAIAINNFFCLHSMVQTSVTIIYSNRFRQKIVDLGNINHLTYTEDWGFSNLSDIVCI